MTPAFVAPAPAIPSRYAPERRLGAGGAGEVWEVKDRITGAHLALKVLAEGAGESEILALVREATALSGLEGLGVPTVVAFGALVGGSRRFMVRELVGRTEPRRHHGRRRGREPGRTPSPRRARS